MFLMLLTAGSVMLFGDLRAASASSSFVETSGTRFTLDGKDFYFAGTNNYYFHYKSKKMVDDVFADMIAMNLKVIRIWGFLDGEPNEHSVMQPKPGIYDESGFSKLDYAIYKASTRQGLNWSFPL